MNSHFNDPNSRSWDLPEAFAADDVRLSEEVLERYILRFTKEKGVVFDPFAGYGTSLVVAERMGRVGLGCEIVPERVEYANALLSAGRVRVGDVREVYLEDVSVDLVISSPPYMNRSDPEDPLQGYQSLVASYDHYVAELASIYIRMGTLLAPEGRLVVQVQNLRNEREVTPLTFDLYSAIGRHLDFLGEEVTIWQNDSYGYRHGYCLVYARA